MMTIRFAIVASLLMSVFTLVGASPAKALPVCADYGGQRSVTVEYYGYDDTYLEILGPVIDELNRATATMPCGVHFSLYDWPDESEIPCATLQKRMRKASLYSANWYGIHVCVDPALGAYGAAPINVSSQFTGGQPFFNNSYTDVTIYRSLIYIKYPIPGLTLEDYRNVLVHELGHAVEGFGDAYPQSSSYRAYVWGGGVYFDRWDIWALERRMGNGVLIGCAPYVQC